MATENRGNPYIVPSLIGAGGQMAAGTLDHLLRELFDTYSADREFGIQSLRKQYGTNVIDVPQLIQQNRLAVMPRLNQMASATGKRLGVDSGLTARELFRQLMEMEMGFGLQAGRENMVRTAGRDLNIGRTLALGL